MKALIVNLQDCEERRDAIKKQMEALRSIDYEFIDAVDGRKMNTQELNQLFNLKRFKSLYLWRIKHAIIYVEIYKVGNDHPSKTNETVCQP